MRKMRRFRDVRSAKRTGASGGFVVEPLFGARFLWAQYGSSVRRIANSENFAMTSRTAREARFDLCGRLVT